MTTISGSLFMTANAETTADFGYAYPSKPMDVVESHVSAAISHQGYTPDVTISYDYTFDTDDYNSDGSDLVELRDDIWRSGWLDGHPDASPHFNFLIMNADEWPNPDGSRGVSTIGDKGDGYPRGGVFLDGVKAADHSTNPDRYGCASDSIEGTIRGAVHEIGHNLGMVHDDGLRYNDYVDGFRITRASPMGCAGGSENACGDICTSYSTDEWDHYYGNCEASSISL